jgi:hypothetical protein
MGVNAMEIALEAQTRRRRRSVRQIWDELALAEAPVQKIRKGMAVRRHRHCTSKPPAVHPLTTSGFTAMILTKDARSQANHGNDGSHIPTTIFRSRRQER